MDAYRKVGRGGAGNFYSQKDVEEVTKAADSHRDLESQKSTGAPPPADELPSDPAAEPNPAPVPTGGAAPSSSTSAAPVYARTGRGGAGNYVDPLTMSSSSSSAAGRITSHAPPHPATVHSTGNQSFAGAHGHQPPPPQRLGGRGGAGNWVQDESQQHFDEEQERRRREALDAKVFDDVKAGLQEPGRAHTRVHLHRGPGTGAGPKRFEES